MRTWLLIHGMIRGRPPFRRAKRRAGGRRWRGEPAGRRGVPREAPGASGTMPRGFRPVGTGRSPRHHLGKWRDFPSGQSREERLVCFPKGRPGPPLPARPGRDASPAGWAAERFFPARPPGPAASAAAVLDVFRTLEGRESGGGRSPPCALGSGPHPDLRLRRHLSEEGSL